MLPHEQETEDVVAKSGMGLGEDAGTMCTFYQEPVFMSFKSEQTGRPVYENMDYVKIKTTGQTRSEVVRKVRDEDKLRFKDVWDAYSSRKEVLQDYNSIAELPRITKTRAMELKAMNIPSIEALAQIPDGNLKSLGPDGSSLKKQAIRWLEEFTSADAKVKEQAIKITEQDDEIKRLATMITELSAKIEQPKAKRGRPPKNVPANDSTECTQ